MTKPKNSKKTPKDEYIAGLFVHSIPVPPNGKIVIDPYEEAARKGLSEETYQMLSREDVGCVFNVWLPTPQSICLVWNIKRVKEVWNFALKNTKEMPDNIRTAWHKASKRGEYFFSLLSLPYDVRKFYADDIVNRWDMKFISKDLIAHYYTVSNWVYQTKKMWNLCGSNQKRNGLGLPGGKITRWEEYYAGYGVLLRACAREFLEEGKQHPVKLAFSSQVPDRGKFKNFLWVVEAHDAWKPDPNNTGVEGETLPPREIPIAQIPEKYFYYSHAQGIITLLEQLVAGGLSEYEESLKIMRAKFAPNARFQRPQKVEPAKPRYSKNIDFAEQMLREGVNQL